MADPFLIHQISDLHVGRLHYARSVKPDVLQPDKGDRNVRLYLQHLRAMAPQRLPDLVVVSGDLTSFASEDEMNRAKDCLQEILRVLERKERPSTGSPAGPRMVIVPGNHDLDWTRATHEEKIDRFARLSDALYQDGKVLSAVYHTAGLPVWFQFPQSINVMLYLFDTTSLGGTNDSKLREIHESLTRYFSTLIGTDAQQDARGKLDELRKKGRRDPGYISPSDLDAMTHILRERTPTSVKIAVMHHNLTSVTTDDVEDFDAVINAGLVKKRFIDLGFDIVMHGHRHTVNCCNERPLLSATHWEQGLFFIGADSLGCEKNASYLELAIHDANRAHAAEPPACRLCVRLVEYEGDSYRPDARPLVEEIVSRPIHAAAGRVFKCLGRQLDLSSEQRHRLLSNMDSIRPHFHELQSTLVDWGQEASAWIETFHYDLDTYNRVYATDVSSRLSVVSPQYDKYLREQYATRLQRLRSRKDKTLCFSTDVYGAIMRTGWWPDVVMWGDHDVVEGSGGIDDDIEIVRVLFRSEIGRDRNALENLDFDHRQFAIPLFVMDRKQVEAAHVRDFAIGVTKDGRVTRGFEYDEASGRVREVDPPRRHWLLETFRDVLAHPALSTVEQYLGNRVMIKSSRDLAEFAANYDKTRRASPKILEALTRHVQPTQKKAALDIGCGTGNYTVPFAGKFGRLTGMDVLEEMLDVARRKSSDVEWVRRDALSTDLPPESLDAVWLISTLHYFRGGRQQRLFREIGRILKPGGIIVADTEFVEQHASLWLVEFFPSLRDRYRGACLPTSQYRNWLDEIGFREVNLECFDYDAGDGDAFLRVGQHTPRLYLDAAIRAGIPAFREMRIGELERGIEALQLAINSGTIGGIIQGYEARASLKGDVGLIVARR